MLMVDETPPPTDSSEERTDLADLVRDRTAELGISVRALAAACIDPKEPEAGPLWTRSTLGNLLAGERVKPPRIPELRALAEGLKVPLLRVQDAAAAQFFGMDSVYSRDRKVRATVPGFNDLSPEDQRKVVELVERFRRG
ncbi:XRE family transcriptional regulator [Streptomyces sp. ICN441]|uniref:XRE family transcriptional regulator n=1 Tax=Streptomyces sp. ICN441 TaxID=2558286 RepID=UPI00106CE4B8|nr:XRE family transcriptional regulator [Streptomyces sp. ICN441]TFE42471.1 XRE family transcriptional regulator [Streptomyces sp. ICN441]